MRRTGLLSLLLLIIASLVYGCSDQSPNYNGQPSKQPVEIPAKTLTPYPEGLVPGTEGWIPPLPQGLEKPHPLSEDEWGRVLEIARTDPIVAEQINNNNIKDMIHYWLGYAGGPGHYADEDSVIMSGKVHPPVNLWYYPAIWFNFQVVTDRHGQLVGIDLEHVRIVLSTPLGPKWAEPSIKTPPPPR